MWVARKRGLLLSLLTGQISDAESISQTFRSIGKINRKINQTGKYEAVFKSTY